MSAASCCISTDLALSCYASHKDSGQVDVTKQYNLAVELAKTAVRSCSWKELSTVSRHSNSFQSNENVTNADYSCHPKSKKCRI